MRREAESADLELEATGKEGEEGEDKAKDNETEEEYEEHEEHEEGEEEAATREVKLRQEESDSGAKRPAQKLGFSLRGGKEAAGNSVGVFVCHVEPESEAQRRGLKVGDQLLEVNGARVERATYDQVVEWVRQTPAGQLISLRVRHLGRIPVQLRSGDPILWQRVAGQRARSPRAKRHSPSRRHAPSSVSSSGDDEGIDSCESQRSGEWPSLRESAPPHGASSASACSSEPEQERAASGASCSPAARAPERECLIRVPGRSSQALGGQAFGCGVVKGPSAWPGIYVQTVAPGSLAERAGLEPGDQLLRAQHHELERMAFEQAIALIKRLQAQEPELRLLIRKGAALTCLRRQKLRMNEVAGARSVVSAPRHSDHNSISGLENQSGGEQSPLESEALKEKQSVGEPESELLWLAFGQRSGPIGRQEAATRLDDSVERRRPRASHSSWHNKRANQSQWEAGEEAEPESDTSERKESPAKLSENNEKSQVSDDSDDDKRSAACNRCLGVAAHPSQTGARAPSPLIESNGEQHSNARPTATLQLAPSPLPALEAGRRAAAARLEATSVAPQARKRKGPIGSEAGANQWSDMTKINSANETLAQTQFITASDQHQQRDRTASHSCDCSPSSSRPPARAKVSKQTTSLSESQMSLAAGDNSIGHRPQPTIRVVSQNCKLHGRNQAAARNFKLSNLLAERRQLEPCDSSATGTSLLPHQQHATNNRDVLFRPRVHGTTSKMQNHHRTLATTSQAKNFQIPTGHAAQLRVCGGQGCAYSRQVRPSLTMQRYLSMDNVASMSDSSSRLQARVKPALAAYRSHASDALLMIADPTQHSIQGGQLAHRDLHHQMIMRQREAAYCVAALHYQRQHHQRQQQAQNLPRPHPADPHAMRSRAAYPGCNTISSNKVSSGAAALSRLSRGRSMDKLATLAPSYPTATGASPACNLRVMSADSNSSCCAQFVAACGLCLREAQLHASSRSRATTVARLSRRVAGAESPSLESALAHGAGHFASECCRATRDPEPPNRRPHLATKARVTTKAAPAAAYCSCLRCETGFPPRQAKYDQRGEMMRTARLPPASSSSESSSSSQPEPALSTFRAPPNQRRHPRAPSDQTSPLGTPPPLSSTASEGVDSTSVSISVSSASSSTSLTSDCEPAPASAQKPTSRCFVGAKLVVKKAHNSAAIPCPPPPPSSSDKTKGLCSLTGSETSSQAHKAALCFVDELKMVALEQQKAVSRARTDALSPARLGDASSDSHSQTLIKLINANKAAKSESQGAAPPLKRTPATTTSCLSCNNERGHASQGSRNPATSKQAAARAACLKCNPRNPGPNGNSSNSSAGSSSSGSNSRSNSSSLASSGQRLSRANATAPANLEADKQRRQHEMLMKEFKSVHSRMFAKKQERAPDPADSQQDQEQRAPKPANKQQQEHSFHSPPPLRRRLASAVAS